MVIKALDPWPGENDSAMLLAKALALVDQEIRAAQAYLSLKALMRSA